MISPKRLPIVSTGRPSRPTRGRRRRSARRTAPGIGGSTRGQSSDDGERAQRHADAHGIDRRRGAPRTPATSRRTRPGTAPIRRPRRSLIWLEKMITAMPAVNPVMTGYGMNLIAPPSRARPSTMRITPGHERRDREAVDAVLLDDAVDDHDERAGRAADLHPRAAQRRDQEPGDDRGVEAALGRDAAGDGERDGQRQRDDADDDARRRRRRRTGAGSSP